MTRTKPGCPNCHLPLTLWQGYKLINFRQLSCNQCQALLEPAWNVTSQPRWRRWLCLLAWSLPALSAMFFVVIKPSYWLHLCAALVVFHLVSLIIICWQGFYQVQLKNV